MHWAVGRQSASEWTKPDESHIPPNSKAWSDNVAIQSTFTKSVVYPEYRTLLIEIVWPDHIQTAQIQAINFVVLEKQKNNWNNNGGQNF